MATKSLDKTLCLSPLRLFARGEPTTFQGGDAMVYRPHNCLYFLRGSEPLTIGWPDNDTKFGVGKLDEYQFERIGLLLTELFGFNPAVDTFKKLENGRLVWNFRF